MDLRQAINLVEAAGKPKLELMPLPYSRDALSPVLSLSTINNHYGKLYKGYVDRFNKGEGDPKFNEAGAFLHKLYFAQFKHPVNANKPHGASESLIDRRYKDFDNFKEAFLKNAMSIQGSGWVYMSRGGEIKTIKDHAIRKDIALLIDWWEHAFVLDYTSNKAKYLQNTWRIVDWEVVNRRIYGGIK